MKIYRTARSQTPYVRTMAVIMGERQIETFEAMCALRGRRPHQLAADILLDAVREAQADAPTQDLVRALHRHRSRLRLVAP